MVQLSTRKRQIKIDGGNHDENLGLKRISCASQFTIPDMVGTSPDLAANKTDVRSSKPNQASRTLISQVRSYPPYRSHLHPPSLCSLSTPLPSLQEHKDKLSLSISPCHHHELTSSAACAVCSVHLVQHTPKIVCHHFILTIS